MYSQSLRPPSSMQTVGAQRVRPQAKAPPDQGPVEPRSTSKHACGEQGDVDYQEGARVDVENLRGSHTGSQPFVDLSIFAHDWFLSFSLIFGSGVQYHPAHGSHALQKLPARQQV